MILEVADIRIQPGQNAAFEEAITRALATVASQATTTPTVWANTSAGAKRVNAAFTTSPTGKFMRNTPYEILPR